MKKLIALSLVVALAACDKPVSTNPDAQPTGEPTETIPCSQDDLGPGELCP